MLRDLGLDHEVVQRAVDASRWTVHGRQTIALHTAPLTVRALWWRAIWEVGAGIAALDGVSALHAVGLTGFTEERVHVSIRHGCRPLPVSGVRIHTVRRWDRRDVTSNGLPRVRPERAAIRAAQWAASDRQAALLLCLVAQQGLTTPARLLQAAQTGVGGRRELVAEIAQDLRGGVHSLGELDFARLCRSRGLPEPSRQVVRRGPRGRIYLDVCWEDVGLAVEIDGAHHRLGLAAVEDNLRQNAVTLQREMVLRIGVIGLRIAKDAFLDQVVEAHRALSTRAKQRVGV
jgi:very-short-patch-repair endonuclease